MARNEDGVTLKLGAQGLVVLPRAFLERLGVEAGAELVATYEGGRVVLTPSTGDAVEAARAQLAALMRPDASSDELIRERRAEVERERRAESEGRTVAGGRKVKTPSGRGRG